MSQKITPKSSQRPSQRSPKSPDSGRPQAAKTAVRPAYENHKIPTITLSGEDHYRQFLDQIVTWYVRERYLPKERKKDPKKTQFSEGDAKFFSKGVIELSERFTLERETIHEDYFSQPRFRSSYLLYFLPLHASKFFTVLETQGLQSNARKTLLKKSALEILDWGSGPGTASFGVLFFLMSKHSAESFPMINFHWVDQSHAALEDGKNLLKAVCDQFEWLKGRITLTTHRADVNRPLEGRLKNRIESTTGFDLILAGNILNELHAKAISASVPFWRTLWGRTHAPGLIFIEPAHSGASRKISHLRDEFLGIEKKPRFATPIKAASDGEIENSEDEETDEEYDEETNEEINEEYDDESPDESYDTSDDDSDSDHGDSPKSAKTLEPLKATIVAPCVHSLACPLTNNRDWCHFSFKTEVPSQWFHRFAESLGSKRDWLKLSYLWIEGGSEEALKQQNPKEEQRTSLAVRSSDKIIPADGGQGRVISDPIQVSEKVRFVLVCSAEAATKAAPIRLTLKPQESLFRGDLISIERIDQNELITDDAAARTYGPAHKRTAGHSPERLPVIIKSESNYKGKAQVVTEPRRPSHRDDSRSANTKGKVQSPRDSKIFQQVKMKRRPGSL